MLPKARPLVTLSLLAALVSARPARADDAGELERARNSYDAGRYQEGADRFRALLDPQSAGSLHEPIVVERARAYYAACLVALGKLADADAQFEAILRANRTFRPDPVLFPGAVVDRFADVRARLLPELEKRDADERAARESARRAQRDYVLTLQKLAATETVVTRHSRWIAAVPFGAGQFQNGQTALGWTFLVTEGALAGGSLAAGIDWQVLMSKYNSKVDTVALQSALDTRRAESLWLGVGFAAVAAIGIVHAELTFVPEATETRTRAVPLPPATPVAALVDHGALLGVSGSF